MLQLTIIIIISIIVWIIIIAFFYKSYGRLFIDTVKHREDDD